MEIETSAAGEAGPVIVPPSPEPDGFIVSVVTAPLSLRARVAPDGRPKATAPERRAG